MSINISELIWTVICFFVLLFVLKALLFNPIIKFMDERKARINAGLTEARQAQQDKTESDAALEAAWKHSAAEASRILAEAKATDEQARAAALVAAHQDATEAMQAARARLRTEEQSVRAEIGANMPELVTVLAGALLGSDAVAGQDEAIRRCVAAAGEQRSYETR